MYIIIIIIIIRVHHVQKYTVYIKQRRRVDRWIPRVRLSPGAFRRALTSGKRLLERCLFVADHPRRDFFPPVQTSRRAKQPISI